MLGMVTNEEHVAKGKAARIVLRCHVPGESFQGPDSQQALETPPRSTCREGVLGQASPSGRLGMHLLAATPPKDGEPRHSTRLTEMSISEWADRSSSTLRNTLGSKVWPPKPGCTARTLTQRSSRCSKSGVIFETGVPGFRTAPARMPAASIRRAFARGREGEEVGRKGEGEREGASMQAVMEDMFPLRS